MTEPHPIQSQLSSDFIKKTCVWAQQFDTYCILDNNQIENALNLQEVEFAVAVGVKDSCTGNGKNDFHGLQQFLDKHRDESPVFGFLTYDLKNQIANLESRHADGIGFAPLYFFVPQHLILVDSHGQLMVMSEAGNEVMQAIEKTVIPKSVPFELNMKAKVSKEEYLTCVNKIKQHIVAGDVYELNYCVEFYNPNTKIDPLQTYFALREISPTPFGAFLRWRNRYLICASPERFLKSTHHRLYSQPIKGTVRRSADPIRDAELKAELQESEKERAENLMIVDLVRNDLARSSKTGSVQVEELFGIYSFRQVHQMISTVSSECKDDIENAIIIQNAFPMGSMTGAPKIRTMQLIEEYEKTKRGLYSGSVGYFSPNGDFDFNVVIRSIQYNALSGYVNFEVGSAITFDSDPEHEYQECLLKAQAMLGALNAKIID